MQMRARDSAAYYSCDDHFIVVDKTVDYGRGGLISDRSSASEIRAEARPLQTSSAPHMPSMCFNTVNGFVCWIAYCLHIYTYSKERAAVFIILRPFLETSYISLLHLGSSSNRQSRVTPKEVSEEGKIYRFAKLLLVLIVKIFAFFHIAYGQQAMRITNPTPPAEPEPISEDHPTVETFSVDHISPVIEHLQRLEGKVDELGSRPPEIPLEKERSLLESWNRIKSIESDLDRTKKVSMESN
jgi:hypothetical protein